MYEDAKEVIGNMIILYGHRPHLYTYAFRIQEKQDIALTAISCCTGLK